MKAVGVCVVGYEGSQWSSMSSGVTCALFGWLNTRLDHL